MPAQIILASSSPWRRQLLDRLGLNFRAIAPDIDESAQPGEDAETLVQRLAQSKAQAIFDEYGDAVVIGSDQVASLDGEIIGKPGHRNAAIAQLRRQSGRIVLFATGVCLLAPRQAPQMAVVHAETAFRRLNDGEIYRYLDTEDVTATAGSLRAEGLGISLVDAIHSNDPTALIGLPLITLCAMLANVGIEVP